MRTKIIAVLLIGITISTALAVRYESTTPPRSGTLDVKSRYMLLAVDGPADWVDGHEMLLEWYGQYVPLPVVIEVDDLDTPMGANLGVMEPSIMVGQDVFHIITKPATPCGTRNSTSVAFITQKPSQGAERVAWVTGVTVTPVDWSEPIPDAGDHTNSVPSQSLANTVDRLITTGKVLHYPRQLGHGWRP